VDQNALVDALRAGLIAGAALDVFAVKPLPADHPFRSLPNVLATPHPGYVTCKTYDIFFREAVEDIASPSWRDPRPARWSRNGRRRGRVAPPSPQ
jgi:phosphoglycerate dehydrogenase-like enzyme